MELLPMAMPPAGQPAEWQQSWFRSYLLTLLPELVSFLGKAGEHVATLEQSSLHFNLPAFKFPN